MSCICRNRRPLSNAVNNGDKLDAIVRLQAELRFVHLDAHLTQRAILSGEQVRLYNRRRGYAEARREGDG